MTAEKAVELLQAKRQAALQACAAEIEQICAKYGLALNAEAVIHQGMVLARPILVDAPPKGPR
jgi:hypothetical protein